MRDKCPKCGAALQATVECYLKDVQLSADDDAILEWDWDGPTPTAALEFDANVRIYCANDHQIARY